ncbi:TetR/AcrR family transcriptional regulator [Rhodalgimonas zhirmunskyi]|uniref:TetR/AcrR family transcriptional regulator n=1 Tax=Rhodalgimonas zhirmunskyi TaxID=2964767 RepID=A0AAJ1U9D7_9RHOB|nr:TetR/AcrR family transcriptional regulator [Rhodoalgimonas zhirmunskyi]MDQ2095195.1 TetR/AcrR family transcriptional regulator [Rhodoalgimonas zhirmunskyi]
MTNATPDNPPALAAIKPAPRRPRASRETVRARIRAAVTQEAVSGGIGALSIASVAKRAKVSAGTIYLHFASKDDMLQQVYLEIKKDVHQQIMRAAGEPNSPQMLKRLWYALFDYVRDHPNDFLFVEFAGAAQVLTPEQAATIAHHQADIRAVLQRAIDDGTLADLPLNVLMVLIVSPAMHLARQALLHGAQPSQSDIDLTFAQVWRAVSVPPDHAPLEND